MKIEAILFDLRDTLLEVSQGYQKSSQYLHDFLASHGINLTPEQLKTDLADTRKIVIATYGKDPSVHDWDEIFLDDLFKGYELDLPMNQFRAFLNRYAKSFASSVSLYPDARSLLEELRSRGIKTGVVIDGTRKRENLILDRTGLRGLTDVVTISEEVGQNKFTDLPLKDALEKLAIPAAEVLVIGDRIDKDIIHANRAGCITAKLERPGGRYTDISALTDEERPDYFIRNLELSEVIPLLK